MEIQCARLQTLPLTRSIPLSPHLTNNKFIPQSTITQQPKCCIKPLQSETAQGIRWSIGFCKIHSSDKLKGFTRRDLSSTRLRGPCFAISKSIACSLGFGLTEFSFFGGFPLKLFKRNLPRCWGLHLYHTDFRFPSALAPGLPGLYSYWIHLALASDFIFFTCHLGGQSTTLLHGLITNHVRQWIKALVAIPFLFVLCSV